MTLFNNGQGIRCADEEENQICTRCELARRRPKITINIHSSPGPSIQAKKRKVLSTNFNSAHNAAKMRRTEITSDKHAYMAMFQKALSSYNNACPFCVLYGTVFDSHRLDTCSILQSLGTDALEKYKTWKLQLNYSNKHHPPICYHCHIPQCHNLLHPPFGANASRANPEVITSVAWSQHKSHLQLEYEFQKQFVRMEEYVAWLNGPPISCHKSNLTTVFLWYTSFIFKKK